jgi:hypothetical protein
MEFKTRERPRAENLPQSGVERTELRGARLRRCVDRLDGVSLRPLSLRRHMLRRVPDRVREAYVLRDQQQRAHELEQRALHTG